MMHVMNEPKLSSNGYEDLNVKVIRVSHEEPFQMFWDWFKRTWIDLQDVEYDHTDSSHLKACLDVMNRRALPTPMEVLSFEVQITGLSRVALAQITRGRIGHCYNVESQMPQKINPTATIPKNIYEDPELGPMARELQEHAIALYNKAYEKGVPPQDCRYMTLHGHQTSLMWNVNYGALLGYFARRCENGLTDELNTVGRMLRRELIKMFLNEDGSEKRQGSGWSHLIEKLDCMGAPQMKCLNNDLVFGNTGRFPSGGEWVPDPTGSLKPDYDFEKSAFYRELLEMPDDLLLPGESEMVQDWREVGYEGRLKKLRGE